MSLWKGLERHPISAEYPNITGAEWESFKLGVKNNGIINERKITLHEGKILDGWQLFRACIELDIQPEFQPLPEGVNPDTFAQVLNDKRRHEDQATIRKRADERRERIAGRRQAGESIRTIAEQEGISPTTVVRDLEQTSTVPPGTVEGKDGRTRPSTKPKQTQILCQFCQHRNDLGRPIINDCSACKALRSSDDAPDGDETDCPNSQSPANSAGKNGKPKSNSKSSRNSKPKNAPDSPPGDDDGEMIDEAGFVVPARLRAICAERTRMRSANAQASKLAVLMKEVEAGKGYKLADSQRSEKMRFSSLLVSMANLMRNIQFHSVHQACSGDGCKDCENRGYFLVEDMEVANAQ